MFQANDLIYYGNTGVCRVEEVGYPPDQSPGRPGISTTKLAPLFETGMIYVPVDTPVFMRPVITQERGPGFSGRNFRKFRTTNFPARAGLR